MVANWLTSLLGEIESIKYIGGLGFAIIAFILAILLAKHTNWGKRSDKILLPAIIIFVAGWILYGIGFSHEDTAFVSLFLRSALSSLEMFVSHSDLLEIEMANHEWVSSHHVYMTIFAFVHFMAIMITMLAALSLLGGKVKQFLKKLRSAFILLFTNPKDLYIFFGVNEASIITANRIYKNIEGNNKRIIFVEFPETDGGEHLGFGSLLGLSSLKPGLLDKIEEIGSDVLLYYANKSLTDIDSLDIRKQGNNSGKIKEKNYKVFKELGLDGFYGLLRYIEKSQNVKVFFLSDDQQNNIRCFEALCSDPYVLKNLDKNTEVKDGPKFTIYCHARRDNLNIVCENRFLAMDNIEVHIVDTSYLSVYYLKTNFRYNPVSFVETKDGCVTSAFNSMIIGFGETGQDVFGFLYEFSAFEGPDGKKSPTHCTIIDNNMDQIKYSYYASHPAIESHREIEMLQMTHKSREFWDTLRNEIQTLNYIVISLGDDEESLSLAISIYYFACRERRNNLDGFKIFVRVYHFDNEKRMNILSDYYNDNNKFERNKFCPNFKDEKVEEEEGNDGTIVIFGELDEIFKLDYIFNENENDRDGYVNTAKEFYKSYQNVLNENDTWDARRTRLVEGSVNDEHRLFKFSELKRKESQDLSNSLHMDTKMHLLGLIPKLDELFKEQTRKKYKNPLFKWLNCDHFMGKETYTEETFNELDRQFAKQLYSNYAKFYDYIKTGADHEMAHTNIALENKLLNLAKTEHRRWVAAQELLGYTTRTDGQSNCDEKSKQHGCICDWNELDKFENAKELKYYDMKVVETTLKLKMERLKEMAHI